MPSALEAELERILESARATVGWFPEIEFVPYADTPAIESPAPAAGTAHEADEVESPGPHDEVDSPDDVLALIEATAAALSDAAPASQLSASIDRIAALETLVNAAAGLLAVEEIAFAETQRADHRAATVRSRDVGRGTAEQIGFARRVSPTAAARHLGFAEALRTRLPQTFQELRAGRISEVQARIAATRSSHLDETNAALVDAAIAPRLHGWSPAATEKAVDQIAYSLDPRGTVDRKATAEQDRRVWVRPAPDSMAVVSALLPMAQGVGVFASLRSAALALHGTGASEGRGIGQLMADLLVERCTGQATAAAVPVEVRVTIPADSVLGDAELPGWVENYGPVPAAVVRELLGCGVGAQHGPPRTSADTPDIAEKCCCAAVPDGRARIRRIFTDPVDGSVVDVDAHSRLFPESMRRHIMIRDRQCRQPYCDAPIRDADHLTPHARGGPTSLANGQGLCLRGNLMKDMPGWSTLRQADGSTLVVTPTGHRYVREKQPAAGLPALTRRE